MKLLQKQIYFKVNGIDEENFIIRGVFSTAAEDRHGEIVDQTGWKLEEYMKNPVVLFSHDHDEPAIGKCIELSTKTGQLEGAIQFAAKEYDFAMTIFKLYAGGFMRAFSVGFMNDKYELNQETEQIILRENTLFEISAVNVPANAMALAYAKGIDMKPLEEQMAGRGKKVEKAVVKEVDPAEAVAVITKSNVETIKSAIRTLSEVLNATDKGQTLANSHDKKVSVKTLNVAIRQLLKAKSVIKK